MRDLLLIVGISIVALALGLLLFFFGPPSLQSDMTNTLAVDHETSVASSSVAFVVLEKGTNALSVSSRTNYRITSESDLAALWPLIYGVRTAPVIPQIDFSTYEVLGIFDGTHAGKGFSVTVRGIEDTPQARVIEINHEVQDGSCVVIPGVSSPFELVEVTKTALALTHEDTTSSIPCASR